MPEQQADFSPLRDLLEQQLSQYQNLLSIITEMQNCLIQVNTEGLDKQVRAQAAQLRQLATLEKKRQVAEQTLCAALNLKGPATLRELIALAPAAQQAPLQKLYADFAELVPSLQKVQKENKELLHTNIELNEMMLSLLTGPEDPLNNFYSADGSEPEERIVSPGIFDQQI